jgi:hypothetical protein
MKTLIASCNSQGCLSGFNGRIPWLSLADWQEFLKEHAISSRLPFVISGTPEETSFYSTLITPSTINPEDLLQEDAVCLIGSNEELFKEVLPSTDQIFLARMDFILHNSTQRFPDIRKDFQRVSYYCERMELSIQQDTNSSFASSSKTIIVPGTFEHWIRKLEP